MISEVPTFINQIQERLQVIKSILYEQFPIGSTWITIENKEVVITDHKISFLNGNVAAATMMALTHLDDLQINLYVGYIPIVQLFPEPPVFVLLCNFVKMVVNSNNCTSLLESGKTYYRHTMSGVFYELVTHADYYSGRILEVAGRSTQDRKYMVILKEAIGINTICVDAWDVNKAVLDPADPSREKYVPAYEKIEL